MPANWSARTNRIHFGRVRTKKWWKKRAKSMESANASATFARKMKDRDTPRRDQSESHETKYAATPAVRRKNSRNSRCRRSRRKTKSAKRPSEKMAAATRARGASNIVHRQNAPERESR